MRSQFDPCFGVLEQCWYDATSWSCLHLLHTCSRRCDQTDDVKTNLCTVDTSNDFDNIWSETNHKSGSGATVAANRTDVGYKIWNLTAQCLKTKDWRLAGGTDPQIVLRKVEGHPCSEGVIPGALGTASTGGMTASSGARMETSRDVPQVIDTKQFIAHSGSSMEIAQQSWVGNGAFPLRCEPSDENCQMIS